MKSHTSDYLELALSIYSDVCRACTTEISDRDQKTIRSRFEDEGVSFLTITLPTFARDFERCLALGGVDPTLFRNFRKSSRIPAFLQGIVSIVFNKETGRINDVEINNSPDTIARAVYGVRQICLAFKKIELPCTPERERAALENFIATEQSFEMFTLSGEDHRVFDVVSSMLWGADVRNIRMDSLSPRHGPGATAERVAGNQKYAWQYWHERLEQYLPLVDGGYPINSGCLASREELEKVSFLSEEQEIPVRVTPVPKTLKGPRIIAIEPCCMQYAQQGLRRAIYRMIESHWCASGRINFRDQSINQSLAMNASRDGRLATIDLSDASDRVPRSLALQMFRSNPDIMGFIDASRSTHAEMPGGQKIGPLNKFASMGSALCFPVEAMYFYTICVIASLRAHNLPLRRSTVKHVGQRIYVYGDDIIVPTDVVVSVLEHLEKYNCKVNVHKTFFTGRFRESCGVDAFLGRAVRPVYVGTRLPKNRRQSREFISTVSTANQFFKAGLHSTALWLFSKVERVFGELPTVSDDSPVIGRHHDWYHRPKYRVNGSTQQREIYCWLPEPVYYTDPLDGYAALQKCLTRLEDNTSEPFRTRVPRPTDPVIDYVDSLVMKDVKHLERSARHGVVAVKRRWVPAYKLGI